MKVVKKIKISFELNIDDLIDFNEFTRNKNLNFNYLNNMFRFIFFMGIFFILSLLRPILPNYISKILSVVLILGFIILDFCFKFNYKTIIFKLERKSFLKNFEKGKYRKALGYKSLNVLESGFKATTIYGNESISWNKIKRIEKTSSAYYMYYIYLNTILVIVIPKRAFESKEQIIEFEKYINPYCS